MSILSTERLKLIKGLSLIAGASLTPWVAFATGDATLPAAIVLSLIAFFTSLGTWADSALTEIQKTPEAPESHIEIK